MSAFENIAARKRAMIEKAKQEAKAAKGEMIQAPKGPKIEFIPPEDAVNKLRIIFDNSGSMDSIIGDKEAVEHAKDGCVEFLRSCTPNKDAVAIHLLNNKEKYFYNGDDEDEEIPSSIPECISNNILLTDLVSLASAIISNRIGAVGGTPLFECLTNAQAASPKATRYIVFSDGEPNNHVYEEQVIRKAKEEKTPIDAVFIGFASSRGAQVLQNIAERTGGIFLLYDPAKKVSFKDLFKYLAPKNRLMLMNAEFKAKLEKGEIK